MANLPEIKGIICTRQMMRVGKRTMLGPWLPIGHKQVSTERGEETILKTLPIGGFTGYLRFFPFSEPLPKEIWNPLKPVTIDETDEDEED